MEDTFQESLYQFQSNLNEIISKINLIIEKMEIAEKRLPNIAFNESKDDDRTDIIGRFQKVLDDLNIDFNLDYALNDEDVKNKATYFFNNISKITNQRAYLTKLVGQIGVYTPKTPEQIQKEKDENLTPEYAENLLYKFESLSADQIEQVRFEHQPIHWLIHYKTREQYTKFDKIMITQKALKMGLIS